MHQHTTLLLINWSNSKFQQEMSTDGVKLLNWTLKVLQSELYQDLWTLPCEKSRRTISRFSLTGSQFQVIMTLVARESSATDLNGTMELIRSSGQESTDTCSTHLKSRTLPKMLWKEQSTISDYKQGTFMVGALTVKSKLLQQLAFPSKCKYHLHLLAAKT